MISVIRDQIARHCQKAIGEDVTIIWDNLRSTAIKADTAFVKINLMIEPQNNSLPHAHNGKVMMTIAAPLGTGMGFCDKIASSLAQNLAHSQIGFIVFSGLSYEKNVADDGYYQITLSCPFIAFNANQHAG